MQKEKIISTDFRIMSDSNSSDRLRRRKHSTGNHRSYNSSSIRRDESPGDRRG